MQDRIIKRLLVRPIAKKLRNNILHDDRYNTKRVLRWTIFVLNYKYTRIHVNNNNNNEIYPLAHLRRRYNNIFRFFNFFLTNVVKLNDGFFYTQYVLYTNNYLVIYLLLLLGFFNSECWQKRFRLETRLKTKKKVWKSTLWV